MRNIIFRKETTIENGKKHDKYTFANVNSIYDERPKNYNYQIKLIIKDIEEIVKEIAELRPLANRLNKLRKELKDYEEVKELLIQENNRLFEKHMKETGENDE